MTIKWWELTPEERNFKKRYARAINRIKAGGYGRPIKDLKEFSLTTKEGTDNTWATFKKDFTKWVRQLREKEGFYFEYVASPELTPEKGLLHVHGVLAFQGVMSLKVMSKYWKMIHGASRVHIRRVKSYKAYGNYIIKHMLKNSKDLSLLKARILMSKDWLPHGWYKCLKEQCRWAIEMIDRGIDEGAVWYEVDRRYKSYCELRRGWNLPKEVEILSC